MEENKWTEAVATNYTKDDKPGLNFSKIELILKDKFAFKNYILESETGYTVRVVTDPQEVGKNKYLSLVLLETNDQADFIPVSELTAGTKWEIL